MTSLMATASPPNDPETVEGVRESDIICITKSSTPSDGYMILIFVPESTSNPEATVRHTYTEKVPDLLLEKYAKCRKPPMLLKLGEYSWNYILISTKSGTGKALTCFENILKPLLSAVGIPEHYYTIIKTESHETVKQFAGGILKERAREGVQQTVVLLSGDGGVVDIINGLVEDNFSNFRYDIPHLQLLLCL